MSGLRLWLGGVRMPCHTKCLMDEVFTLPSSVPVSVYSDSLGAVFFNS